MKPLLLLFFLGPLSLAAQTPWLIKGKIRDKVNAAPKVEQVIEIAKNL